MVGAGEKGGALVMLLLLWGWGSGTPPLLRPWGGPGPRRRHSRTAAPGLFAGPAAGVALGSATPAAAEVLESPGIRDFCDLRESFEALAEISTTQRRLHKAYVQRTPCIWRIAF